MAEKRLPPVLAQVKRRGLLVFGTPYSANLVVVRGPGGADDWDGLLTLSWRERTDGPWAIRACPAATRPGSHYLQHPLHPRGTATIEPGQYRLSHARGFHHVGKPNQSPAWVQVGSLLVKRDNDLDPIWDPAPELHGDATGCNVHQIDSPKFLAGCTGAIPSDLADMLAAYDWLDSKLRQPRVSLTIVDDPLGHLLAAA